MKFDRVKKTEYASYLCATPNDETDPAKKETECSNEEEKKEDDKDEEDKTNKKLPPDADEIVASVQTEKVTNGSQSGTQTPQNSDSIPPNLHVLPTFIGEKSAKQRGESHAVD